MPRSAILGAASVLPFGGEELEEEEDEEAKGT